MVLGLLKNIPILNSFLGKSAASQESSETEVAAKANEKAIIQEGLKPLFIVALPEGDFSELKVKLKEKFNGRDLHFEVDPELKEPKLYIIKPNALAKRNLETVLDKAFIKENYKSIELSGDGNKLGESLLRTMNTEFSYLKGAERKIEYAQKQTEKVNSRQTLEKLSQMGVHVCSAECEEHKQGFSEEQIERVRDALSRASNSEPTTSVSHPHNTTQVQTEQKRREDLKAFFTKSQKFEDSHLDHNKLIQASNSIYLIRNHNPGKDIDLAKIELTFAHRDNTTDNFTIRRLPLMDFLNGVELPASSEEINNKNFHSNEFHKGMIAQSALSLLEAIEQNNSSQIKTVIEDSKQREKETKQQQTKRVNQKIGLGGGLAERTNSQNNDTSKTNEPITDLKSLVPLIRKINIEGKHNWSGYRTSVAQLGEALQVIKPDGDEEHRELEQKKELHGRFQREISVIESMDSKEALEILSKPTTKKQDNSASPSPWFIQNYIKSGDLKNKLLDNNTSQDFIIDYINSRIKIAQRNDLSNLAIHDTRADLEQSNLISKTVNSKLGNHFKDSEEQKDKQVGGIALTGQFSFIDRKEYHEKNKTYKDFPPLPESWKTESNSLKPNTQETQMNHNPANSTQQATVEAAKTSTETVTHHTETAVSNQNEQVSIAAEEMQERENTTQL
jgi:hypothetical protein